MASPSYDELVTHGLDIKAFDSGVERIVYPSPPSWIQFPDQPSAITEPCLEYKLVVIAFAAKDERLFKYFIKKLGL